MFRHREPFGIKGYSEHEEHMQLYMTDDNPHLCFALKCLCGKNVFISFLYACTQEPTMMKKNTTGCNAQVGTEGTGARKHIKTSPST